MDGSSSWLSCSGVNQEITESCSVWHLVSRNLISADSGGAERIGSGEKRRREVSSWELFYDVILVSRETSFDPRQLHAWFPARSSNERMAMGNITCGKHDLPSRRRSSDFLRLPSWKRVGEEKSSLSVSFRNHHLCADVNFRMTVFFVNEALRFSGGMPSNAVWQEETVGWLGSSPPRALRRRKTYHWITFEKHVNQHNFSRRRSCWCCRGRPSRSWWWSAIGYFIIFKKTRRNLLLEGREYGRDGRMNHDHAEGKKRGKIPRKIDRQASVSQAVFLPALASRRSFLRNRQDKKQSWRRHLENNRRINIVMSSSASCPQQLWGCLK